MRRLEGMAGVAGGATRKPLTKAVEEVDATGKSPYIAGTQS